MAKMFLDGFKKHLFEVKVQPNFWEVEPTNSYVKRAVEMQADEPLAESTSSSDA